MACKASTAAVSEALGNPVSHLALVEGGKLLCDLFIEHTTPYSRQNCPGIIRQQWGEEILPMLTDQLLNSHNMCTFIMNLCELDKWNKVDVKEWVNHVLEQKPVAAKSNSFVNDLYKENAKKF